LVNADPVSFDTIIQRILSSIVSDGPVTDIRVGTHWTAVVVQTPNGLRAGLAATQFEGSGKHGAPSIQGAGRLLGRRGTELGLLALSENAMERSLGFAAMNALLEVPEHACVDESAEEVIRQHGKGKRVAVVGHFPFVDWLRQEARECWVLELDPGPEDWPASFAPEMIPQADVVAITGMTLLNRSFLDLVRLCHPDAYVLLLGPSTPLSPVLFDYGVSALSGTVVVDIPAIVAGVSQGATFRQLAGRRLVTMESATRATSAAPRPGVNSIR
jgi:uncharacterized protein